MDVCPRCSRHVRASDARCPFCARLRAPARLGLMFCLAAGAATLACETPWARAEREAKEAELERQRLEAELEAAKLKAELEEQRQKTIKVLYGKPPPRRDAGADAGDGGPTTPPKQQNCAPGDPLCTSL